MTSSREPSYAKGDSIPGTPYVFEAVIGAGGHGTVIRAKHAFLDKPVVIKLLHANLGADEDLVRRNVREAQILAKMEHPNIVGVTDGGMTAENPPRPFFVMDALQGLVLYRALKAAPNGLGFATSVSIILGILDGLDFAHTQHKVIHRDIKPPNIFIHRTPSDTTVPKLLDFGIAHVQQAHRHTGRGFLGTPRYAAPEQILGERPTARTDLYAVGLVLYECLLGRGPFADLTDYPAILGAHLNTTPVRLSSVLDGVPPALDEIVQCLLEKSPSRRPESAAATAVMLRLVKGRLDRQRQPLIEAPEFRTEPTPFDNTLLTTRGEPASSPNILANDTVPGAPPFTDVVTSPTDPDAGPLGSTAPSPVDLGRTPIDREARTRSQRDGTPILPRHGTERIDAPRAPVAEDVAPGRRPSSVRARESTGASETPISSSASVSQSGARGTALTHKRRTGRASLVPWVVLVLTMIGASVALIRYGPRDTASPPGRAANTAVHAVSVAVPTPPAASAVTAARLTPSAAAGSAWQSSGTSVSSTAPLDAGAAREVTAPSPHPRESRPPAARRTASSADPASIGFD